MRQALGLTGVVFLLGAMAFATIFGSVRGVVHDPQHRPIPGAQVTLKAQNSGWTQSQDSNENGEFEFTSVPIGNYTVTVSSQGFQSMQQSVIVQSGTSPAALPVRCGGRETNRERFRNSRGGDHRQRHADHHAGP